MIYMLPVKEHVGKPERPQAKVPGASNELAGKYNALLKKYKRLNETYTMLIKNYTELKMKYQSLAEKYNETFKNLKLKTQELKEELKAKGYKLILYRNLTVLFIITTITLAIAAVYSARRRG